MINCNNTIIFTISVLRQVHSFPVNLYLFATINTLNVNLILPISVEAIYINLLGKTQWALEKEMYSLIRYHVQYAAQYRCWRFEFIQLHCIHANTFLLRPTNNVFQIVTGRPPPKIAT